MGGAVLNLPWRGLSDPAGVAVGSAERVARPAVSRSSSRHAPAGPGERVLRVVVVVVAVSWTTFAAAFGATLREGQAAGAPCRWSVVTHGSTPARTRPSGRRRGWSTAPLASMPPQPCGSRTASASRRTAARRSSGWQWSTRPPTSSSSRRASSRTRPSWRDCDPGSRRVCRLCSSGLLTACATTRACAGRTPASPSTSSAPRPTSRTRPTQQRPTTAPATG